MTSEWVMDYMTGLVPFAWHFNARTQEQYLRFPARVYTGSGINPDVSGSDFGLGFLFGQSMYGEGLWPTWQKNETDKQNWDKRFAAKFYLNCLQYFFLNTLERKSVSGTGDDRIAYFSNGVSVSLKDSTVRKYDVQLREKNTVLFSVVWKEEPTLAVYSANGGGERSFQLFGPWKYFDELGFYEVSISGLKQVGKVRVKDGSIRLKLTGGQPYVLKPISDI